VWGWGGGGGLIATVPSAETTDLGESGMFRSFGGEALVVIIVPGLAPGGVMAWALHFPSMSNSIVTYTLHPSLPTL